MKRSLLLLVVLPIAAAAAAPVPPGQAAPYLGQRPPGDRPVVFAPGVVSRGDVHGRLVVSPDGREILWTTFDKQTFSTRILSVRSVDGSWTSAEPPSFARDGSTQGPLFSPDGRRLFFTVRSKEGAASRYVEASPRGWSSPREDAFPRNGSSSFTRSGRVYFSSSMESKTWGSGIFVARQTPGAYADASPLDPAINVPGAIDYTPFVAPDESFLLFSSNRPFVGEREEMRIHVAFRTADGIWSTPRKMFDVAARFPSLSPDGKYLFFCGDDGNVYWVDAKVIETFRPDAPPR